jgi:hypothetical protein
MIVVLQYWGGDEERALTLARMLADIEQGRRRKEVFLVLARRGDCPLSDDARKTVAHCQDVFSVMPLQSPRPEVGHPDGCFGLWAGSARRLYELWQTSAIPWQAGRTAFFCESDGAPIRRDWINRLIVAHAMSRTQGKRVTGAVMDEPMPHVNGNLVLDLQIIADHPSLLDCPPGVSWDLHHAPVLMPEARASLVILNEYNTRDWTPGSLAPIGRESAWVHGCKDNSVLDFVRLMMRTLWRAG